MLRRARWILIVLGEFLSWFLPGACAQTANETLQLGLRAYEVGDLDTARQDFSLLAKRNPSALAFNYLAMAEADVGKLDQAIAHFQRSIQLGNRSAQIHYNLGLAYIRDHEPEGGIREFRRALELDPKYLPARYGLGVLLLGSDRTREAIRCFDEARKQSPRDPRVLGQFG